MNLTQKEKMLLQDQKKHEELCIKKYNSYANQTQDQNLKQIFKANESQEQQHLNTINQILNGQTPNMSQQQNQQNQQPSQQGSFTQSAQQNSKASSSSNSQNSTDADLCTDLLSTEKYVSSTYDTAIFEFRDPTIRQALNHIQKEEQQHGENIFQYMQNNGMYQTQ